MSDHHTLDLTRAVLSHLPDLLTPLADFRDELQEGLEGSDPHTVCLYRLTQEEHDEIVAEVNGLMEQHQVDHVWGLIWANGVEVSERLQSIFMLKLRLGLGHSAPHLNHTLTAETAHFCKQYTEAKDEAARLQLMLQVSRKLSSEVGYHMDRAMIAQRAGMMMHRHLERGGIVNEPDDEPATDD